MDDRGDNRRHDGDDAPPASESGGVGKERRPGLGQPMTGLPSLTPDVLEVPGD